MLLIAFACIWFHSGIAWCAVRKDLNLLGSLAVSRFWCQCSSAVEQRFRKPSVAGSIPAIGSILWQFKTKDLRRLDFPPSVKVSVLWPFRHNSALLGDGSPLLANRVFRGCFRLINREHKYEAALPIIPPRLGHPLLRGHPNRQSGEPAHSKKALRHPLGECEKRGGAPAPDQLAIGPSLPERKRCHVPFPDLAAGHGQDACICFSSALRSCRMRRQTKCSWFRRENVHR